MTRPILCPQSGKECYPTSARARTQLRLIAKPGVQRTVYLCRECSSWHVGTRKPKPKVKT